MQEVLFVVVLVGKLGNVKVGWFVFIYIFVEMFVNFSYIVQYVMVIYYVMVQFIRIGIQIVVLYVLCRIY